MEYPREVGGMDRRIAAAVIPEAFLVTVLDGFLTSNGIPRRASSSRRRGDVEARMSAIYNAGEGSGEVATRGSGNRWSGISVRLAQCA